MKKINRYLDRHPLLAIALGALLLVVIVLVAVPKDPDYVDAAVHMGKST
ncbi:hypothetical protein [Paraburkholderia sp. HD33-4]|nr:hypothetical protein [Paraburkholderia sp. HD33-4]